MLKQLTPAPLLESYRRLQRQREKKRNASKTLEEIFTEIYAAKKWAPKSASFDSGAGSKDQRITEAYLQAVRGWLTSISPTKLRIVDLGCGDFSVGRQLVDCCAHYSGVDIVKPLIDYNTQHFATPTVEFFHLDITKDPLPDGDVCFLRQVLQHLSNDQIQIILERLRKYRWSVITEHHPSNEWVRETNIDKPHGADIRIFDHSGVFLDQPPFDIPKNRLELLLEVKGHEFPGWADPGMIRTYVVKH